MLFIPIAYHMSSFVLPVHYWVFKKMRTLAEPGQAGHHNIITQNAQARRVSAVGLGGLQAVLGPQHAVNLSSMFCTCPRMSPLS